MQGFLFNLFNQKRMESQGKVLTVLPMLSPNIQASQF